MTATLIELVSYDNAVFRAYAFWSAILILKMLAMAFLTSQQRTKKQVVPNPEDVSFLKDKEGTAKFDDPDVERVRRAHRNDLENCLPFMIIGFIYVLTDPSSFIAINLFRVAVLARIVHTYVYAVNPMQPARGIAWLVCFVVTAYMSLATAFFFC